MRVGIAYVIVWWVTIQVTDTVAPAINLPEWSLLLVIGLGAVGLPFVLLLAWVFELTPEGIKRESEVDRTGSVTRSTGRKLDFFIIAFLLVALSFVVVDQYILEENTGALTAKDSPEPIQQQDVSYDSIAVLPFQNMSSDPEQEYFSDGISEELLNSLAKFKNLSVAARTSAFAFKGQHQDITEIGKKLKVATVLEGSVRRSGSRLRVTAQLIDVTNGYHLWSETYERELVDVFALQDDLTKAIVSALKVHLDTGENQAQKSAVTVDAYDNYLKGIHQVRLRRADALVSAIIYFEQAIELEPEFADAIVQLAKTIILARDYSDLKPTPATRFYFEQPRQYANELIDKAHAINPDLAEAYAVRGLILMNDLKWAEALNQLNRALALNPGSVDALHWSSLCYVAEGRLIEAVRAAQRAHLLDPIHAVVFSHLAYLETHYGFEVELNLEPLKSTSPERYYQIQYEQLTRDGEWAEAYQLLVNESAGKQHASGWKPVQMVRLKVAEGFIDLSPEIRIWIAVTLGDFEEAKRALAHLESNQYWNADAVNAAIHYLSGDIVQAEILLRPYLDHHEQLSQENAWFLSSMVLTLFLADTLQQSDKHDDAQSYLDKVEQALQQQKKGGVKRGYHIMEARLRILQGNHEAAVQLLKQRHELGGLRWYDITDPVILQLAENPAFIAIKTEVDNKVDEERAELGWPPATI